eukprot:1161653-Pelagomonas_calceolata.AAC.4
MPLSKAARIGAVAPLLAVSVWESSAPPAVRRYSETVSRGVCSTVDIVEGFHSSGAALLANFTLKNPASASASLTSDFVSRSKGCVESQKYEEKKVRTACMRVSSRSLAGEKNETICQDTRTWTTPINRAFYEMNHSP